MKINLKKHDRILFISYSNCKTIDDFLCLLSFLKRKQGKQQFDNAIIEAALLRYQPSREENHCE